MHHQPMPLGSKTGTGTPALNSRNALVFPSLLIGFPLPRPDLLPIPAFYPIDRTSCMNKDGPDDVRFRVHGGELQYLPNRNSRFPYVYSLPMHALLHSSQYIKKILIHIVDMSYEACVEHAKFDRTLSVPLGPNDLMKEYGALFIYILFNPLFYFISFY